MINIDELTIGQVNELKQMFACKEIGTKGKHQMLGRRCLWGK